MHRRLPALALLALLAGCTTSVPASEPKTDVREAEAPTAEASAGHEPDAEEAEPSPEAETQRKSFCDPRGSHGAELQAGTCTCEFRRCNDICCAKDEICIHPGKPGGWSKCARRPR